MTFLQPEQAKPKVLQGCKNVVEQKPTKGEARLGFCVTRSAEQALSIYRLLNDVWAYFK
jgi:hypothetical protein